MAEAGEQTWVEIVSPVADRFYIAATMGLNAIHNPEGTMAVYRLLMRMAEKLDYAVERSLAELPAPTPREPGG